MEQVLLAILHYGEDVSKAFGNILGIIVVFAFIFFYFKYLRNTTKIIVLRNGEECSTPSGNPSDNGTHKNMTAIISPSTVPIPMEYQAALCKKQWEECSGKFSSIQESLKNSTVENTNMMRYITDIHSKVTKLSDKTRIALTYLAEKPIDAETARMIKVILSDG
jgi:hypothetical protein